MDVSSLQVVGNYPGAFSLYKGSGVPSTQFLYADINKLFALLPLSTILQQYPA